MLAGDLSLLGMDWLYVTHAQSVFSMMTVRIGLVQGVNLRTSRMKKVTLNDCRGFVHAYELTTLMACHIMTVTCVITRGLLSSCDAVFESNMMLRDRVDLLNCTVRTGR